LFVGFGTLLLRWKHICCSLGHFRKSAESNWSLLRLCLSSRMEQLGSTGRILMKFCIWAVPENLSKKKMQVSLKSYRNDRYFNSDGRFSEWQIISTNRYITKQIDCAKFHAARYQVDTRRQHMVSYAVREYIQRPAHGRRGGYRLMLRMSLT
jgi:hypothetical protein